MPKQEIFFEEQTGDRRIEVLKSYDQTYALEASKSDPAGLPKLNAPADVNGDAEAGPLVSFFIVNVEAGKRTESVYVSPDWPSAKAFAKKMQVSQSSAT